VEASRTNHGRNNELRSGTGRICACCFHGSPVKKPIKRQRIETTKLLTKGTRGCGGTENFLRMQHSPVAGTASACFRTAHRLTYEQSLQTPLPKLRCQRDELRSSFFPSSRD